MANKNEVTVWGIHAGVGGTARSIFINKKQIALGWDDMGDLGIIPADREAFKTKLMEIYPDEKKGWYPMATGQLFRFVHEVKIGDIVIYPSKLDRIVHIGEVVSDYKHVKDDEGYSQRRAVKWLKSFQRTKFSQGALYEIGSAMSFFKVKSFSDEFIAFLEGKEEAQPAKGDKSIEYVADDIEQTTDDFILKTLAQDLKGHAFSHFVAHLLGVMGYKTSVSPEGPDGGIDILAHKDELGFEPPIVKVQVKSSEGSIGDPVVSQLYGKVDKSEYGMFVTLGIFTNQAKSFARNKSNLKLIDGEELVGLILRHYEKFDSKYKALLPLRQIYIPELPAETEE